VADGWICTLDTFPAIKFFSPTDQSQRLPTPITCVRVDKHITGASWREWASWFKLARILQSFPF
jgi:hypothetical protein